MQTNFLPGLTDDPALATSEKILRKCVHCGFCTATCPTFLLLGDENDSPRGRIYLIKDMLETNRPADRVTVTHVDRCLSCLSCTTTCPSGVDYMHLVDHARAHIEKTYRRPLFDRLLRQILSLVLPRPALFRPALILARLGRPLASLLPARLRPLLALAPDRLPPPSRSARPQVFPAHGTRRRRVALLTGCAQQVLDPTINDATIRLLTRHGAEVVIVAGFGCCGALPHHMGKETQAQGLAAANIAALKREIDARGLDYVVANTSGCGTTLKDYGFMFRDDENLADTAALVAAKARDVSEVIAELGLAARGEVPALRVAYHSACSLQHGQKITRLPADLLRQAGFETLAVPEGHICCGSAGTYNLLQPDIAAQLRDRKVGNILSLEPDVIAAGNIGCMVQIGSGTAVPVVHTVELLDWATGGPRPARLDAVQGRRE